MQLVQQKANNSDLTIMAIWHQQVIMSLEVAWMNNVLDERKLSQGHIAFSKKSTLSKLVADGVGCCTSNEK